MFVSDLSRILSEFKVNPLSLTFDGECGLICDLCAQCLISTQMPSQLKRLATLVAVHFVAIKEITKFTQGLHLEVCLRARIKQTVWFPNLKKNIHCGVSRTLANLAEFFDPNIQTSIRCPCLGGKCRNQSFWFQDGEWKIRRTKSNQIYSSEHTQNIQLCKKDILPALPDARYRKKNSHQRE